MNYLEFKILRVNELIKEPRCRDAYPDDHTNMVGGLLELLSHCKQPQSILEIGSHRGISTELFLLFARTVLAVDPFEETAALSLADFNQRCSAYTHLKVIKGRSPDALKEIPDESFDLVYIDAEHTKDAVQRDINAAYRLVRDGGHIAGHDYTQWTDVPKAVEQFVTEHALSEVHTFSDGSWAVQKTNGVVPK